MATTHQNRDVASFNAPKIMDDEYAHRPGPIEDAVHREDTPYIKKRKSLIAGRGFTKKNDDECQGTSI